MKIICYDITFIDRGIWFRVIGGRYPVLDVIFCVVEERQIKTHVTILVIILSKKRDYSVDFVFAHNPAVIDFYFIPKTLFSLFKIV